MEYGKLNKRIVFTDTDHRHAQLIVRLSHDGLTQSDFFRCIVGGYIENDPRLVEFVHERSTQSKKRKADSRRLIEKGQRKLDSLGLNEGEIENIFDLIEKENPDL